MKSKERPESKKQQSAEDCKRQGEARPENKQSESKQ